MTFLLPTLSGLLLAFSFPPFDLSFLAWISVVPLLLVVVRFNEGVFLPGLVAGVVFRTISMYWLVPMLHSYAQASWPVSIGAFALLVLYLSAYTGLFTLSLRWTVERHGPAGLLAAPFLWTALEYANEHVLTGFHWLPLAASQAERLSLIQLAEFSDAHGLSFLLVFVNVAFTLLVLSLNPGELAKPSRRFALSIAMFVGALVLSSWVWGDWRVRTLDRELAGTKSLKVRIVNPAVPQDVKWTFPYRAEAVKQLAALSKQGSGRPDLILWPEAAAPFYFEKDPFLSAAVYQLSSELKTPILFGGPGQKVLNGAVAFTNSAFLVGPGRRILGRYDKRSLVPFGEYVPLGELLSFVPPVARGLAYAALTPGSGNEPLRLKSLELGVLICYEAVFKDLVQATATQRTELLVNLTNDAWLGPTGARQHLAMARFAPIETRRPMIRVANRGTSAIFASSGRMHCLVPREPAAARDCRVSLASAGAKP